MGRDFQSLSIRLWLVMHLPAHTQVKLRWWSVFCNYTDQRHRSWLGPSLCSPRPEQTLPGFPLSGASPTSHDSLRATPLTRHPLAQGTVSLLVLTHPLGAFQSVRGPVDHALFWMCIYSCHSPDVAFDHCLPLRQVHSLPSKPHPIPGYSWAPDVPFHTSTFLAKLFPWKATCLLPIKPASLVAQMVSNLPAMWETRVPSLSWEDPAEKRMTTHFNILAYRISWTEEPSRLHSMGSQRVGHIWETNTFIFQNPSQLPLQHKAFLCIPAPRS